MEVIIDKFINVVEEIAKGNYSNDIINIWKETDSVVIQRLAEAIAMMMVKIEAREEYLNDLVDELKELNQRLKDNVLKSVTAISSALQARDVYTMGHTQRVADYSVRLARRIGLPENQIELIRIGGLLHDIGKIGFTDKIFNNEDPNLPPELLVKMKEHPKIGYEILKNLDFLGESIQYVYHHHEREDGKGYPDGLKSEEIPLGAKIISICDCYDAMTTDRPYQKGKTKDEAVEILRKISGTALSGELVEVFIEELVSEVIE